MGVGRGGGAVGGQAPASVGEKAGQLQSSLVKLASSAMQGLKAVFAKVEANDDKAIAHPPGMKPVELPNQPTQKYVDERVKFSDVIKQLGLLAATLVFRNPIPLMMANAHAKNLQERLKAKEKELTKQAKALQKAAGKAARTKVVKNEAEIKQIKILERKMEIMRKQNEVLMAKVNNQPTVRQVSTQEKQAASKIKSQFVKLGFSPQDAQRAVNITLQRVSPSEADKFMKEALKEVVALKQKNS